MERGLVEKLKLVIQSNEADFTVRSGNCLYNAGMTYVWQLVEKTERDLLIIKNLGRKSYGEIKETLGGHGLEINTVLTDALKRELGAPLTGGEPHEETEDESAVTSSFSPSLETLQRKLEVADAAIENVKREISEAQIKLARAEEKRKALKFNIDNYNTIRLGLS